MTFPPSSSCCLNQPLEMGNDEDSGAGSEEGVDVLEEPLKPGPQRSGRAAEVHNLSEKRRRNRINEKMKELQDLVPNSNKNTNKASMLVEAIEYIKLLQMQVQGADAEIVTREMHLLRTQIKDLETERDGLQRRLDKEVAAHRQFEREIAKASQLETDLSEAKAEINRLKRYEALDVDREIATRQLHFLSTRIMDLHANRDGLQRRLHKEITARIQLERDLAKARVGALSAPHGRLEKELSEARAEINRLNRDKDMNFLCPDQKSWVRHYGLQHCIEKDVVSHKHLCQLKRDLAVAPVSAPSVPQSQLETELTGAKAEINRVKTYKDLLWEAMACRSSSSWDPCSHISHRGSKRTRRDMSHDRGK